MAVTAASLFNGVNSGDQATAQWIGLTQADTGNGVDMASWPDKTVQVVGTFGGGTVQMEGSNDNTNWSALHDFQGNSLAITDTSLKLIAENSTYIRPRATAGAGMTVTITVKGAR